MNTKPAVKKIHKLTQTIEPSQGSETGSTTFTFSFPCLKDKI